MKTIINFINSPSDLKHYSTKELSQLSQEIRSFLIDNITQTGGHLAPNLGVVELTIALHYVFDSSQDSFIWDVGHQAYTHKILTGRKHLFSTLRKKDGLSGYPNPLESHHDIVHTGHSSTSVSIGVGIATAKKADKNTSLTISIIGDGSFTSGMVYEALNDASWRNLPILIILNDNKMSISENVGGIASHLNILRTNKIYLHIKNRISRKLSRSRIGIGILNVLYSIKSFFKRIVFPQKNMFENLGIKYLGPFDGHNLPQLISLFQELKNIQEPTLIHIITEKGAGHNESRKNPTQFHGISGIEDIAPKTSHTQKSWSSVFGKTLCTLAESNPNIFTLTAAMREGTGLVEFSQKFPERFIDVGIAEQHAVTCAAGLAIQGKKPIVAIYSTFLQRAYDQIIHDVALENQSVLFCLDRSGFVPGDGPTHQGVFDIAYLRTVPNMTIMSPLCEQELFLMMKTALEWETPVAIRYPKDIVPIWNNALPDLIIGQGIELSYGKDGMIVIFGSLLQQALDIQILLQNSGLSFGIYHLRFAKPIDNSVIEYLKKQRFCIILEEGIFNGGLCEYFQTQLTNNTLFCYHVGDVFPHTHSREGLLEDFNFNPKIIAQDVLNIINKD